MKRATALTLTTLLLATNGLVVAAADAAGRDDAISRFSGMLGGEGGALAVPESSQASGLVRAISEELGVSQRQAVGGSSALLGLAKNRLDGAQFSQLTQQVPGIGSLLGSASSGFGGSTSMLSGLSSLSGVQGVFSSLGMSPETVSRFAPIMLDYLGSQGVGQALLGSLGDIWSP